MNFLEALKANETKKVIISGDDSSWKIGEMKTRETWGRNALLTEWSVVHEKPAKQVIHYYRNRENCFIIPSEFDHCKCVIVTFEAAD